MRIKKYIVAVLTLAIVLSFTACKDKKDNKSNSSTVTGGSVEDVFGLTEAGDENPTIDSNAIDGDSGKVDAGKATSSKTTATHNIKKETTVSSNLTASSTSDGYKLSWKAVSGAKNYNIYRSSAKDGEYSYVGTTSNTYYVDKNGSSKYFYKVTVAADSSSTTKVVSNSSNFKGNATSYANQDSKQTYVSSQLNNAYIAYVRNEYAKHGIECPPGRLAYVKIEGNPYVYIFQFDNTKTWNGGTLEQVQIFTDAKDSSKYFSFFTKSTGSAEYLAARSTAITKWNDAQGKDGTPYDKTQEFLVKIANDPVFQQVINASY